MSIEEYADNTVRGLLGTAFAAAEPPLRDLASGSIARGDAARRRNRAFAGGGAALSVVAVIGTFALVSGTTVKPPAPKPANQATSAAASPATSASPTRNLAFGPVPGGVAKNADIRNRLPALLQPLLPPGITAGQPPSSVFHEDLPMVYLTGAGGTNQVTSWVGYAPPKDDEVRQAVCSAGGVCRSTTVAGGTVYFDEHDFTATASARAAGFPADVVKPGTGNAIVSKSLSMVFVPTDRTKYAFNFALTANTANIQYVDHEPSDYVTGGEWPPRIFSTMTAFDPSGLLMSPDDLTAMLSKPGLDKVEELIDPRTAISPQTQAAMQGTVSQIDAAVEAALPDGYQADVDTSTVQANVIVTGPTGKNSLQLQSTPQNTQFRHQTLDLCPRVNVTCTKKTVPGGTLEVWAQKPTDSKLTVLSNTPSSYNYWYLPDDTSKPTLEMTLVTDAGQVGLPTTSEPDPGETYSVSNGPYEPVQVTSDQFMAAVESGQLATAASKIGPLLASLK